MGRRYIFIVLALMTAVFASCRKDVAKVIPRGKMAKIYAEMLVTDQWITSTPGVRRIADTSLVYEPILESYGYTSADYRRSVDHYMNDPERFSRIFRTAGKILEDRLVDLREEQARQAALELLPKIESDFKVWEYVPYWKDETYVHYFDSLDVVLDSATLMYRFVSIERGDTLYDRIRMVKPDSLAVTDSSAAAEVKNDSLKINSLNVDSLTLKKPFRRHERRVIRPEKFDTSRNIGKQ